MILPDKWPDSRCFSMQSSPNEELIRITYAVKGCFTRQMEAELRLGTEVTLKLPYGELFTLPHSKANNVFIAGGTGITPFLSLFTDSSFTQYDKPVLYAGFRTQQMNIYTKSILKAKEINSSFEWYSFYEDTDGRLNIQNITEQSKQDSIYFISGPPEMIKDFKLFLMQSGVFPYNVITDDWS